MIRSLVTLGLMIAGTGDQADGNKQAKYPTIDYDVARTHEIGAHRRSIPTKGAQGGFNQLSLRLTVSATGEVVKAEADGQPESLKLWPTIEGEVEQWSFSPFEQDGKAVVAEVQEYVDLVPPERLPTVHVAAPVVRPDSKVTVTLERSGCYGSCPAYNVALGTEGIVFEGEYFVVAAGRHTAPMDASEVRELAKRFVAVDFYSMDPNYRASVTDMPSYALSIDIDGKKKRVGDYVGEWEGMPAVVSEFEEAVDKLARTDRWIKGTDGLVEALKAEKYDFVTYEAQVLLKSAARGGQTATVSELLAAGVPLKPMAAPKKKSEYESPSFERVGWLSAASRNPEVLELLIEAGASKDDQSDKDLALVGAAESGKVGAVRALVSYGANPNVNLGKLVVTQDGGGGTLEGQGSGSILIYAAQSGSPEMVREILKFHPRLEAKDREGKTAVFAAGDYRSSDVDGARAECVRLLAKAGANVNARDNEGNTPLHETFLTDVEEELLKLGANVNARNDDGETPIFATVDNDALLLFLEHGADLTIRNKKGETVVEAADGKGPLRVEKLKEAILLSQKK